MKLADLKCDFCEKKGNDESTDHSNLNSSTSTVGEHGSSNGDKLAVQVKCIECNYFLCATCFADHQAIASFATHTIVNFNNLIKENDQENEENLSEQQRKMMNQLNTSSNSQKQVSNAQQIQISNLAQLQQQFNSLEDQIRVKNKQQQQSVMQTTQQHQHQRLVQIEAEIQKSYNFYMQMLKERKDYLINELNTIMQYAVLNHNQNYNKQLKLKAELDQKRVNLGLSDSMQTFLSNDPSKVSPFNDLNNNKVSSNMAELNNLTLINNQIIAQLKANSPLSQIEFVSNYSAIQTSIRNTFGYIRINNKLNAAGQMNNQMKPADMVNFNEQTQRNLNNSASVYDYLTQMNMPGQAQRFKSQNELHVDLNNEGAFNENQNLYENFGNGQVNINTFSASSQSSNKSTNSSVMTASSSNSFNHLKQQQKPIGTSQSCYDNSSTSPISISTDNLTTSNSSCLPSNSSNGSSSNYFLDHWSNPTGINDLIQKSKTSSDLDTLSDDFFNSTMVKGKNSWSSIVSSAETEQKDVAKDNFYSPYFDSTMAFENGKIEHNQSPTLAALLNNKNGNDKSGVLNKFNNHAITLSAGSNKSTTSTHSNNSQSFFQNKLQGTLANNDNLYHANQKQTSAVSSTSNSPEERVSLSSSASSACSEPNYQDSSHALYCGKSILKANVKPSNTINGQSIMDNLGQLSNRNTTIDHSTNQSSLAVGSSTRSQLRRSKMIYHCKFGEFGINDGQFTEPSGVTINTSNDIIVADTNSHRIQIFDKDGRFKFKFGECGKRDGQLLYPNRVSVVKHTGDIVVTERSPTHQIQIYNKYGQFLRKFGANILQHPRGVCVDNKGRIIVVECKVMRVLIFDLMGNVLQKFNCSKYLEFPNGVCCSSGLNHEEIYISDNRAHCIKVFDYNGNFIRQIGGEGVTNYPIGVGINSNNEILVADNHNNFNLTVFSQDGQLINALESKVKHAQCFDVGLMDDGSIVLASKDYRIYVYKYVNNNLSLSSSYTNENNQLVVNDQTGQNDFNFEQRDIMHNEEQLYDLFSPQMVDLTNYNQLMGLSNNSNQFGNLNKSCENLLDNLNANTFNCLMSAN